MKIFFYLFTRMIGLALGFIQLMMFVRAILSFLPVDEKNPIAMFAFVVTEPVIFPIRQLLERMGVGDGLPIDIPFFVTYLILVFIGIFV